MLNESRLNNKIPKLSNKKYIVYTSNTDQNGVGVQGTLTIVNSELLVIQE